MLASGTIENEYLRNPFDVRDGADKISATSTANGRSSLPNFIVPIRPLQPQRSAPMRRRGTANQQAALAEERLSELKSMLADMQRDRDAWRDQAQRLALPKPDAAPMSWWRWLRTTG